MKDFILHPYEYAGSNFNPKAHAETRLEIAGKKRNFVLKLHEGVLYFKEPARAPVFAIPDIFNDALATDSIGLISRWQREVAAQNYGAFFTKRDFFAQLPVRGHFLLLIRADGNGWMREHFDEGWFDLPDWERPHTFDLWNEKTLDAQVHAVLPIIKSSLLQRVVTPEVRQAEMPRWVGGSAEQFAGLVTAAMRVFLEPNFAENQELSLKFKSHSAFAKGDIEAPWLKSARMNSKFDNFWHILEREIHFVGVHWNEGGEKVEMYARPRSEKVFQAGLATWKEDWRGNWAPQRGSVVLEIPRFSDIRADQKQEAILLLRAWLQGKVSEAQIEELIGTS